MRIRAVTLIMTLATLAVAYRGQRGKYLTVIKREGAMFYLIGLGERSKGHFCTNLDHRLTYSIVQ